MLPLLLALPMTLAAAGDREDRDLSAPVGGSVQGIVRGEDYPPQALDRNEEGTVHIRVEVNAEGRVSECVVEQSSGSAALDSQTCRLVWLRAKLKPARDRRGRPVAGSTTARITWRIAQQLHPSEDWVARAILRIEPGKDPSCQMEYGGAFKPIWPVPQACPVDEWPKIPRDLIDDANARVEMVSEQRFAGGTEPKHAPPTGYRLLARQVARLEIDREGKLSSCRILETTGDMDPAFPGTCEIVPKSYLPKKGPAGAPAAFTAFYVLSGYARAERLPKK